MDFEDLSPVAIGFGIVGALIGVVIVKRMSGAEFQLGLMWKILTPIATGIGGWAIVQKMAE